MAARYWDIRPHASRWQSSSWCRAARRSDEPAAWPDRHEVVPHGISGKERRQAHIDWLKLIEVSGPFLSVPVLTAEWPDLEPLDTQARDRLRREHRQWQDRPARAAGEGWIGFVLEELLGWQGAVSRTTWSG